MALNIRKKVFLSYSYSDYLSSLAYDKGLIVNIITKEVEMLVQSVNHFANSINLAIMSIVYIGFALYIDVSMATVFFAFSILIVKVFKEYGKLSREASLDFVNSNSQVNHDMIEFLRAEKYFKIVGLSRKVQKKTFATFDNNKSIRYDLMIYSAILKNLREVFSVALIVLIIFINYKYNSKSVEESILLVFIFYRVVGQFYGAQISFHKFIESSGSLSIVHKSLKRFEGSLASTKKRNLFDELEENISIELKDVVIGYKNRILNEINIKIKKNSLITIIGSSGTGKTTLGLVIAGVLDPVRGDVIINAKLLNKDYFVGYVPQESFLFEGTVLDNITLFDNKKYSLKQVESVLKDVGLIDFFEKHDGVYTLLGSGGINLSGGQKQKMSIARELIKNIDILILDEITSSLDPGNEKLINNVIVDIKNKITVINITHKYDILKKSDQILDLDKYKL